MERRMNEILLKIKKSETIDHFSQNRILLMKRKNEMLC